MTDQRRSSNNVRLPEREPGRLTPSSARASIGGVGGGTGLVAVAQSMGPGTTFGAVLLYLAPAASFVVGSALYYVETQAGRYLERRLVDGARKTLERQLDNPRTSDEHKARIRRMLEEMETSVASRELERIRLIGTPSTVTQTNGTAATKGTANTTRHGRRSRQPQSQRSAHASTSSDEPA
jgi:hypothetical protein